MIRGVGAAAVLASALAATPAMSAEETVSYKVLTFDELDGWSQDDHAAALTVFLETCADMDGLDWGKLCAVAQSQSAESAKTFFELFFRPTLIEDGDPALFTGYFEPELTGSRWPSAQFRFPIYKQPPEARRVKTWLSRRDILTSGVMRNRGLEIVYVDDPVELFFLQIQGSGRIRLPDGETVRVGYGGSNGHPYRSIGQELVRRGVYNAHQVSAQVIRNWVRRNPAAGEELLYHNPSYVFFRELKAVPSHKGPLGAMNRSITPLRTVAVDPAFVPMGAPVWLEKDGGARMRRLMIAQDTGSAIKGAQRADIFFGAGDTAGQLAGRMKDPGRMVVLMPIQLAYALASDDF